MDEALGFVETRGLVAAIEACDAMLKAARVRLVQRQVVNPALITICVEGETAAVKASVDAGARAAERVGRVVSTLVIPRPAVGLRELAGSLEREAWSPPPAASSTRTLAELPVRELRALARRTEGFPLGGRQISQANKEILLSSFVGLTPPE